MDKNKRVVIAIDGPAGSGKSTVAKRLAETLGLQYVDSGAMYRAVTLKAMREGVNLEDPEELVRIARSIRISFGGRPGAQRVFVDGEDVTDAIRADAVSRNTGFPSKTPGVREELVRRQRETALAGGVVMDGRDIGSVVFPDADLKFYLDASLQERAGRRARDLAGLGEAADIGRLREDLAERDERDRTRKHSPLVRLPEAVYIDTTGMPIERVLGIVRARYWEAVSGRERESCFYWLFKRSSWLVFKLFFGFKVRGADKVPAKGGAVYACNHASYFDPVLGGTAIRRPLHYMARSSLFAGLLGYLIRKLNAFPVGRGEGDKTAVRATLELLREGRMVLIFPEGSRTEDGRMGDFEPGAALLASKSGVPVVPVYIAGSYRVWPRGRRLPRPGKLAVFIGDPLDPPFVGEGESRKEVHDRFTAALYGRIQALESEAAKLGY